MAPANDPATDQDREASAAGFLKRLTPLAGILVFLAVWQIGVMLSRVPAYLLPAPTEIAQHFIRRASRCCVTAGSRPTRCWRDTSWRSAIAIPLAIAITSSHRFDQFVMPTMLFFQVVPKVAIAPLFLVWFGVGPTPKILVAFLISFFPIVIDAAVGLRSMSTEMTDLARSMGASRRQVFAQFRLPTSLPYLFSGLEGGGDAGDRRHGGRRIRRRRQRASAICCW